MFPVSIKGVLCEGGRVVLLENDRSEWELPGGRLEPGETPENCLMREVGEELGIAVDVGPVLDCWVYEVLPQREVLIVIYGLCRRGAGELRISSEHRRIGLFGLEEIERIPFPSGYHRAVAAWAHQPVDRQSQPSSLGRSRNTQATVNGGSGSCCASITGCANPGFQS